MTQSPAATVIDASMAIAWVTTEEQTPAALRILEEWERAGTRRLVPFLFLTECAGALVSKARRGLIDAADIPDLLGGIMAGVFVETEEYCVLRAVAIAIRANASLYDSMNAALAERIGCELWTADERFYNAAHPHFPWVRWTGERTS